MLPSKYGIIFISELVQIKQEIKESSESFAQFVIRSQEDAEQLATSCIMDEDR